MKLVRLILIVGIATALHAQEPPPPGWSGNFAAGLSLTRGNSDTKNISLAATLADRWRTSDLLRYDAFYLRGDENGLLTVDRTTFGVRDEHTFSPLTYGFADVHYLRDRFKEIDYLITPNVGVGHHFIRNATVDLAGEAGVGDALESDEGLSRNNSGTVDLRELLTWKFSPTATLTEVAAGLWKTRDLGDALYHVESSVASSLTAHSELKVSAIDDYKSRPPAGVRKNDFSLIAAWAFKF